MKKMLIFIFTIPIILFSCKSEQEKNLYKMKEAVIKNLNDKAFKHNETLDILKYSNEEYNIKDENYLDTLRLLYNFDKINYFRKMMALQIELMKNITQQAALYRDLFGAKDNLTKIKIEDFKEEQTKFKHYRDSVHYYTEQDSLIKQRINGRKNIKPIYHYKAYIKFTTKDNNSNNTQNFADTIYRLFDDNFNLITY